MPSLVVGVQKCENPLSMLARGKDAVSVFMDRNKDLSKRFFTDSPTELDVVKGIVGTTAASPPETVLTNQRTIHGFAMAWYSSFRNKLSKLCRYLRPLAVGPS